MKEKILLKSNIILIGVLLLGSAAFVITDNNYKKAENIMQQIIDDQDAEIEELENQFQAERGKFYALQEEFHEYRETQEAK